jgi:hypothetical protein
MKANCRFLGCLALIVALTGELPVASQDLTTTITLRATAPQAAEAFSTPATFTVHRAGNTNFSLLVFYHIAGTASNSVDYQELQGTVQLAAGVSSVSFTVTPLDDHLVEGTEIVSAEIIPSPLDCVTCDYEIGTPSLAEIFIVDNDREGTNQIPVLNFYAPQDGTVFTAPANIQLQAFAQDREDGHYVRVEFFEGDRSLGLGRFVAALCPAPYCPYFALTWSNVPPGQYQLTARVTDSAGAATSATVRVSVVETNRTPFVRLDIPHDGDVFYAAPTNIYLQAFAQDAEDGYFVDVEFFADGQSLGPGAFNGTRCAYYCPNYVLTWSNVPPGQYVLTARATNHRGVTGTSAPVNITVLGAVPPGAVNILAVDSIASETSLLTTVPPDTATFNVRRVDRTNAGIVVFYEVTGTASNGVDYEKLPGYVTLPPGVSSAEIVVSPIDDLIAEGAESVVVTLTPTCPQCLFTFPPCLPPQGTNCFPLGPHTSAVVWIRDNEEPKELPVVDVVARDPIASEGMRFWWHDAYDESTGQLVSSTWDVNRGGTNTATFVVRRDGPTNAPLVVNYEISGTASNSVDYAALPGSVTIAPGKRTARIVVTPIDDFHAEGIETVMLRLDPSGDYSIGFPGRASAIIVDNDRPRPLCTMLPDGKFHLCCPATNGFRFRIEASTDLLHWSAACTNIVTDGALHFVDSDAPAARARFYRVASEPSVPPDD